MVNDSRNELMWYVANVLLRSEHEPSLPQDKDLWEELFVLVDAADEQEAIARARAVAAGSEAKYKNAAGESIEWKVISVNASPIERLEDGAELFSRFLRDSEARSLLTPFDED